MHMIFLHSGLLCDHNTPRHATVTWSYQNNVLRSRLLRDLRMKRHDKGRRTDSASWQSASSHCGRKLGEKWMSACFRILPALRTLHLLALPLSQELFTRPGILFWWIQLFGLKGLCSEGLLNVLDEALAPLLLGWRSMFGVTCLNFLSIDSVRELFNF